MINLVDTKELNRVLDQCVLSSDKAEVLSQESLAFSAYSFIDIDNDAPRLARWGCILILRQLAGPKIKGAFKEFDDDSPEQCDLFEGLQGRYHAYRDGNHVAVPEEQLTLNERYAVERRMEKEIDKKRKHLLLFRARTQQLINDGYFKESA